MVWAVNFKNALDPLPEDLVDCLEKSGKFYAKVFTIDELTKKVESLNELKELSSDKSEDFMIIFEPPSIDDRIVNQYALFSVMTNAKTKHDKWLKKH